MNFYTRTAIGQTVDIKKMDPAEQDEVIDSQVAPSNPAEPGDAGTENNDENNNLVSDNGEVVAAEESSEPADGIGDEAAGDAPVQSDYTFDNNVTEKLEKEDDEGQREDVDMEEGELNYYHFHLFTLPPLTPETHIIRFS